MKFRTVLTTLVAFVATASMSYAANREFTEVNFTGEIVGMRKQVKFTAGMLNKNFKYVWHVDMKIDSFETPYTIDPMFTQWLNHSKDELSARIRMESDYEGERPNAFMYAHGQMAHEGEYRETLLSHRKKFSRGIRGPLIVKGVLKINAKTVDRGNVITDFMGKDKWEIVLTCECVPNSLTGPEGDWTASRAVIADEEYKPDDYMPQERNFNYNR